MTTEDDRTVIVPNQDLTLLMPSPGGQATAIARRSVWARAPKPAAVELQRRVAGINPLLNAANTLLALVAQLRTTTSHANPERLRSQLLQHVREFESAAAASGVKAHHVSAARYLLCSFIDEVVETTPWGSSGAWKSRNLLQEFHDERQGGEKAFKLLERLEQDVPANRNVLELFYVCLALGFEGRYAKQRNSREQLDEITERVLELVHPAATRQPDRALALHSEGVATLGNRDLAVLPTWVVVATGAAVAIGAVLLSSAALDRRAQPVLRQIHELPLALHLERPSVAVKPRLAPPLQADIARGALEVRDEALRSVVTLPADALFVPGSARVEPAQLEALGRVAAALKEQPGQVIVIGHTDGTPTGSLQYTTNWSLSRERAKAVAASLATLGLPADRLRAEGRADVEPRVPGDTPAARASNRRIEIELQLVRPDA
jgi:type VI secretion system protein ImpK